MKDSNRAPRVAMVVERFPQEPFIAQQVEELLRRSVDVHVLCQIRDTESALWSEAFSGRVHPWPDRGRPVALSFAVARVLAIAASRSPRQLASAARSERSASGKEGHLLGRLLFDARVLAIKPDVVHYQFGDLALRRIHTAAAVDAAFSTSFRGYDLAYAGLDKPAFYNELWPVLDGAHTLGNDLRRAAIKRGAPPTMDWTIIPPAIDADRFDPGGRQPRSVGTGQPYRIVSVGRLHWKKGLPDGLQAVAEVKAAGHCIEYRIVGDGPEEERLRWTIDDLGLSEDVTLTGGLSPAEVREQLIWADAFLHPALTEGFGNAVLEAQAMQLPVVCTNAEGLTENVVDSKTGFVVDRGDPTELAFALRRLITQDELGPRMGAHGRQRVIDNFSLDSQTDDFVEYFGELAGRLHR